VSQGYIEYQVMKEFGWTYQELQETPAEVIWDIIRYINTEGKYNKQQVK